MSRHGLLLVAATDPVMPERAYDDVRAFCLRRLDDLEERVEQADGPATEYYQGRVDELVEILRWLDVRRELDERDGPAE